MNKNQKILLKETCYKTKGGYYYRRYKNGKVKRISKEDYNKRLKFNSCVIKLKKVIKEDNYAYPEALKYTEKYIKKYGNKNFTITEIARMIYEDNF